MALGGADLSRVVLRVKSRSAIAIHRLRGETGPLWQKGFHDHAVHGDEDVRAAGAVCGRQSGAGRVGALGAGVSALGWALAVGWGGASSASGLLLRRAVLSVL
jgi:hypothetical protein